MMNSEQVRVSLQTTQPPSGPVACAMPWLGLWLTAVPVPLLGNGRGSSDDMVCWAGRENKAMMPRIVMWKKHRHENGPVDVI